MRHLSLTILCAAVAGIAADSYAAPAPYAADSYTLALYHFDELAGAADPGNPFGNSGSNGVELANTGGPDGRDDAGVATGGYGGTALAGFGSSFDVLNSGNGIYNSLATTVGGGARTSGAVAQSLFQGATGAFTYEAMVNLSGLDGVEQTLLSHDGDMAGSATNKRGFMLRLTTGGQLSFYHGLASGAAGSVVASLPASGSHAFAANEWFHVAVTYDGNETAADALKLYWTRVDSGVESANLLGSGTLPADLGSTADENWFGVGTTTRGQFRFQPKGFIDEVRVSSVARGADEFMFTVVPEPGSMALLFIAGAALIGRRRA